MLRRQQKAVIIEELKEKLQKAKAVILTDFKGLESNDMNELRKKLRESGVEYKVVKNTIIRLASQGTPLEEIKETIVENNALAITYDDPVALAKTLAEFDKQYEAFKLKIGFLEGKLLQPEKIKELAQLPSREVLLAQVLGTMNAVPRNFVSLLHNMIAKLVWVLEAIKQEKEKQ